ncbi:MAG: chromosome segregation protein SMC [Desulfobulbaceae bacterium A2]|nr:MAG: chromosome segregation protein SMC [Desulfobulbaceae bacterium A2]
MLLTRIQLKNWRNFSQVDVRLRETVYLIGPNASGKSNFLDALRFLRDVATPRGGGLQAAIADRHGMPKLRSLVARAKPEVEISLELAEDADRQTSLWRYELAFTAETSGHRRNLITRECVWHRELGKLLNRPNSQDKEDKELLTQTALENTLANKKFRDIAKFFASITYMHLVPQLLRHPEFTSPSQQATDPFGQRFLERVAKASDSTRKNYLKKMEEALTVAVPQLRDLKMVRDDGGIAHLEAIYKHWRPRGAKQWEDQFSDGTLRLIGLLWCLLEGHSPLLLEEPELSLNDAIVERIPVLIDRLQRRRLQQVIMTTHSYALLANPGIDARGVLILEPDESGTRMRGITEEETVQLQSGLSIAEVLLPKTRPESVDNIQLN